ncbi:flavin monoamine oxidase family protein [Streptomyces sp. NPDC018000]|uniref:flavin monoamine oxidase family protein n=1 Tax=Streptomyces sp. NPDC018000 TaxID=3365028 RepID=UPI0037AFC1AC
MPTGGTPWMRTVRALRAEAQEAVPVAPADSPTRRGVLRGALAAGGALAATAMLPASAEAMGRQTPHDARIVVVGAGLAGLTCAYRLAQQGVRVRLFEARDGRVGGRCWSARGFASGQVAEHGGEFIDTRHVHIRKLATELGLSLDDREAAEPDGDGVLYLQGVRAVRDVYRDMPVVQRRIEADAKRIGSYTAAQASRAARAFDEMSMRDWLDANVPGGSSSLLASAIGMSAAGFFGSDPEDLSAINLIEQYVAPDPGADDRYHTRGGNDLIPNQLAARLPKGTVRFDAPLLAVRKRGTVYELKFSGTPKPVVADRVVFALPFTALRRTDLTASGLSTRKRDAIEHHGMGTNAKLLLQFRERFARHGWSGSLQCDVPQRGSWDSSATQGGPEGLLTIFNGGHAGASYPAAQAHGTAPAYVVKEALEFIDRLVPGMAGAYNGRSWLDSWVDDPWTHGSYASFAPGQYTKYWGCSGIAEGALHFAGEHTSTHSQGYLNGGVESGERAAREVLAALRQR